MDAALLTHTCSSALGLNAEKSKACTHDFLLRHLCFLMFYVFFFYVFTFYSICHRLVIISMSSYDPQVDPVWGLGWANDSKSGTIGNLDPTFLLTFIAVFPLIIIPLSIQMFPPGIVNHFVIGLFCCVLYTHNLNLNEQSTERIF